MAVALNNSFEGGSNGVTITTGNSGGDSGNAWDVVVANGTITYDTAHAAVGVYACNLTGNFVTAFSSWTTSAGSISQVWFRQYLYFTANPGATVQVQACLQGGSNVSGVQVNTAGKIEFVDTSNAVIFTTTNTIPLNQWFRIEGFVKGAVSTGQVELKLFLTANSLTPDETQTSAATQSLHGVPDTYRFGLCLTAASAGPYWQDEIGLSDTGYLGPATPHSWAVQSSSPFPPFSAPFIEPNAVPLQLQGDRSPGVTQVSLTDTGTADDTSLSVLIDYGYVAGPLPFPPFSAPFIEPNVTPFQLAGDATTPIPVSLTDTGTADDTSITVTAAVPLTDTAIGDDTSFTVDHGIDPVQAWPLFAPMFLQPSAATQQFLGDTNVPQTIPFTETGTVDDAFTVDHGTDPVQSSPYPFPPFSAPFIEPNVIPFQLLGDASGLPQISLIDTGTADDTSITVTATVAVSDSGAAADTAAVTAVVSFNDTGTGTDSVAVQLTGVDSPAGIYYTALWPPLTLMLQPPIFQLEGGTGVIPVTTVPPYTVTAVTSNAASVSALDMAAVNVTSTTTP